MSVSDLPGLNACLNGLSALLLLTGFYFIKQGNRTAHRACMVSAFTVSVVFLISYLIHHALAGIVYYPGHGWSRTLYLVILGTHTLLAILVPFLAIVTLRRALKGDFAKHRQIARITFPIWLYVSVTGVVVYFMLYRGFLLAQTTAEIRASKVTSDRQQFYDYVLGSNFHKLGPVPENVNIKLDFQLNVTATEFQTVVDFLKNTGFFVDGTTLESSPGPSWINVSGSVALIEKTFQTNLDYYEIPLGYITATGAFYAPDRNPSLALKVPISRINGLKPILFAKPSEPIKISAQKHISS